MDFSVDVYPYDTTDEALQSYSSFKTIHFIRHAEATHDLNEEHRDTKTFDTRLTHKGKEQCRAVAKRIAKCRIGTIHHDIYTRADLLVTSPMTRCMQTIIRCTKPVLAARPNTPVIAHEYIRDTINFQCDRRRPVSELAVEFPIVQFDLVSNHDTRWDAYEAQLGSAEDYADHRESAQIYKVADRARTFFQWLGDRPETYVVLCTDAGYLNIVVNFGYGDDYKVTPQTLDDRADKEDKPVLIYKGDEQFAQTMRAAFDHCDMRSVRIAFR